MNIEFADASQALDLGLPVSDVYLHPRYGESAEHIDNGVWECAFDHRRTIAFPYIRRPIETTRPNGHYDIVSPYGYGGVSVAANADIDATRTFRAAFLSLSKERGLVAEFLRLNPLLDHSSVISTVDTMMHRETFGSYVVDPDEEFRTTSVQHRTAVRKALKCGVNIVEVDRSTLLDPRSPFRSIYAATMERVGSRDSLRLPTSYFEKLCLLPTTTVRVLEARQGNATVAACIFLVWLKHVHYHLSGSTLEGRKLQATDLMIDYAVRALADPPFTIHLGGGHTPGDSLSKFKRRASSKAFLMTLTELVVNQPVYNELSGDTSTSFFPAYRAPELVSVDADNRQG